MKYQGGKSRIAGKIAATILDCTDKRIRYVEPFVGGASVAEKLVPHFGCAYLSDIQPDLILLYQGIQSRTLDLPDSLSEAEYYALKEQVPSALRGFAAFGCSWGGKLWGGYGRDRTGERNFANEAKRGLEKKFLSIGDAHFRCHSYLDLEIYPEDVIYCDPPYFGTTEYAASKFDSEVFADTLNEWVEAGAVVFVSEATQLRANWTPVWEGVAPVAGYERKEARHESLYRVG